MSKSTTVVIVTGVLAAACTELPDVDRGVCGNHVVEAGEDCDGFAPEGAACGTPDDAHACRFDCSATACPDGLACGLDGLCRSAGGFAEAPQGPWTFDVARMAAADVDGDRRSDVVGIGPAGISVRFAAADGRLDDRHEVPLQLTGPAAAGDIDGDGRADVIAPMEIGMLAYSGSAERRLDAVPFTVFAAGAVTEPMHVGAVQLFGDFIPVTYPTIIQQSGICFAQVCDIPQAVTVPPAALTVATLFPAPHAELDGGLSSEELVLAADGASAVYVYEVETFNPGSGDIHRPRLRQTLALPGPARTAPRLLAYDGDGRLDLMIGVEVGGELRVAVALGSLSGQFNAAAVEARFDGFMNAGCSSTRWPLAVGDFFDLGDDDRPALIDGVRAAAPVEMAPGSPPALALIAGGQLLLAEPDGAGGWLAPTVLAEIEPEGAVSGLLASDVDGDGLHDLVVLRGGRLWTWLRLPGPLAGDQPADAP